MKKVLQFCLDHTLMLNLLTLAVVIFGLISAMEMNREAFPMVDFDTISIRTVYPGASPKEVEKYVTNIIEDELSSIDGIEEESSYSIENVSLLILKIDPDLSEHKKTSTINNIQQALNRIRNLPKGVEGEPILTELNSGIMPVLEIALTGLDYKELHRSADELMDLIKKIPDAKDPLSYGFRNKEVWVELNPQKLKEYYIGISEVIGALAAKNVNLPGGVVHSAKGDFLVRTIGEVGETKEIGEIIVRTNYAGKTVRIKDIGRVRDSFEEEELEYYTNGEESINIIVRKSEEGDIIRLVDQVKDVVAAYSKQDSHKSLKVSYVNDMSKFVRNRLGVLVNNGFMGIALVLICLLLFLSKGIALVTAFGMPVALLGAIAMMNYLGMTINLLTLFALVIVLGMLVDDAIIVAENIWQHYEMGKTARQSVLDGVKEVFWPVCATILTTIAAFSPLLMVSGIFGKFIEAMPKVVMVCLSISLIEAMFILPCHAYDVLRWSDFLKNKRKSKKRKKSATDDDESGRFMKACVQAYKKILGTVLTLRYVFLLLIIGLMGAAFYLNMNYMSTILFPNDGIEFFFVRAQQEKGTPLKTTRAELLKLQQYIHKNIPSAELESTIVTAGLQQTDNLDPFKVRGSHVGQVGVYLTSAADRERSADQLIETIRDDMNSFAASLGFEELLFVRQRMGPPVGKPVAIRLYGDDFARLQEVAAKVKTKLATIEGVRDIGDNFGQGKREIIVKVDEQKAGKALLSTFDIAHHLRAFLAGEIATYLYDHSDRIPVRVRYDEDSRNDVKQMMDSQIINKARNLVPLRRVAEYQEKEGISGINHLDFSRLITVTANIDEKTSSSSYVNEKIWPYLEDLRLEYPDVPIARGGEFEDTSNSMNSLRNSFIFAVLLIFIILSTQFNSLTQPFVVMFAIPFGIIGVIFAFYLHGLPLSFLAMIGMIGLSGVVVNDSIVLVDFINSARKNNMDCRDAIIYAGGRRIRAVWLTSITTIFGLLPLAYGIGGEDAFLKPAAMALGYGLIFSTILILLLVPAAYLIRIDILNIIRKIFNFFFFWTRLDLKTEK